MALINQNSIIGVTSITSPSSSNVLTVHANDTTERLRVSETGLSFSGTNSSLDTSGNATFNGNVSIGGTLTYEDVTNIDSVGVITARNAVVISEDNAIHFRGTAADDADAILRASAGGGQLLINSRNDTIINIDSNNDSTDAHFAVAHGAATGVSTELFRVQEDGSVGIGTDDPTADLEVYNSNQAVMAVRGDKATLAVLGDDTNSGASETDARIILCSDGTIANAPAALTTSPLTNHGFEIALINDEPGSGLRFHDGTANKERLRITSSGEVGIGTDNPLNGLDVNQSEGRLRVNRFSHLLMQNKNNSTTNYWGISTRNGGELDIGYGTPDGNSIVDGDKLTITSAGVVGINTTNPQSRLEVFTDNDTDFGDSSNTNNTNSLIRLFNKNGTDNTAVNNYVGIRFDVANGATSSAWLSYVRTGNNTGAFQFKARNAASSYPEVARILSSGGITFGGDTAQANALNDYEEGTLGWRLQRTGSIGSGTNNSDTKVTYTKIGNRVYVSGYLYTENTSNSTGVTVELRNNENTNQVATLPYEPNQAGGFPITGTRTINDSYRNMAVTFRQGQSQVYIYTDDGNNDYLKNTNNVQINSAQTHLVIQFCGSYTTNS